MGVNKRGKQETDEVTRLQEDVELDWNLELNKLVEPHKTGKNLGEIGGDYDDGCEQ